MIHHTVRRLNKVVYFQIKDGPYCSNTDIGAFVSYGIVLSAVQIAEDGL